MKNIKLTIEYDGISYNGWQAQRNRPGQKTIQEEIEEAIRRVTAKTVTLSGSGRTDSGVSAKAQIANFKIDIDMELDKLKAALNANLQKTISIVKVEEVVQDFHARFSVKSKVYRYTILNRSLTHQSRGFIFGSTESSISIPEVTTNSL